jgi:hypothetical protein
LDHDNAVETKLNLDEFANALALSESRIVFIGIVDSSFKLKYSNFRVGAKLYANQEVLRNLMTIAPRLVIDELEKLEPVVGKINSVLVRFEKRVLVFSRLNNYVVVVGFDTEVPTPFPEYIAGLIKTAAKRART